MKLLACQAPFLALTSIRYALALPVIERDRPYTLPIAHVPVSASLKTAPGVIPNVILLNKADLLTEGTVVAGSPASGPIPQKRDVIGPENRFLQTKTGNPWDYIGRYEWQVGNDGYRCSGSLVGPRHLATARHCVNTTNNAITYTFRPNYDQGARGYTAAQVTDIMYIPGSLSDTCSYGDDWAVMVLNQRIGDKYGYFGAKQFDSTKADRAIFWHEGMYFKSPDSASEQIIDNAKGYPIDLGNAERPYVEYNIIGKNASQCNSGVTGPILTQADAAGGQSGGPLWLLPEADGVRYQYGVCSGGSSTVTMFAGRTAFVNAVAQARKDFP